MKYHVLSVKMMPDIIADLDAYALEHFPIECPKCHGNGEIKTGVCPNCEGVGHAGNRSDAVRYLLQFAIASDTSPEARAMAAVYANVAPKFISEMTRTTHKLEGEMRDTFVSVIEQIVMAPAPKKRKRG